MLSWIAESMAATAATPSHSREFAAPIALPGMPLDERELYTATAALLSKYLK
jgi:hypothetical protein